MTTVEERIAQFENMVKADPENDMAHFSLGSQYMQVERYVEAAECFQRCLHLNPDMSKAYQLAGEVLIKAGQPELAIDVLKRGYESAASKGDLMPRNAMGELLRSIGHEPPAVDTAAPSASDGNFVCKRTGRPGTQLSEPPYRGPVGQWIRENISKETWDAWIGQGTKVINELRLDFSRERDQDLYDQHMYEFLGIDDAMLSQIRNGA
jgi:Fe-S cluster biosynthesis and repair protein YggX